MYSTFGQRLQYYIDNITKGNVSKFSDLIDVPQNTLGNYVNDVRYPKVDLLITLLKKFPHINVEWLLIGKGLPELNQTSAHDVEELFTKNGVNQKLYEKDVVITEKELRIQNLEKDVEHLRKTLDYFLEKENKQKA